MSGSENGPNVVDIFDRMTSEGYTPRAWSLIAAGMEEAPSIRAKCGSWVSPAALTRTILQIVSREYNGQSAKHLMECGLTSPRRIWEILRLMRDFLPDPSQGIADHSPELYDTACRGPVWGGRLIRGR